MTNHHQSFITEYLRHRSPFTAYCLAYNLKDCSNYESIMSSANRLMNNEEVGGTIRSILDNIRHEVEQEVRAELKQELLTVQRKRELLASIATGEMVAVQLYKGKDCNVCTQMVRPTINQMLRAIDLDNKMVGLYPVYSRQSTVEKVPKPQQFTTNESQPAEIHREEPTPNLPPQRDRLSQEGNEKGNRNISQQNTTNREEAPLLFLGGENGECDSISHSGVVDSSRTDNTTDHNNSQQNPEKNTPIGNISQQSEKTNTENHNNSQQSRRGGTAITELSNYRIAKSSHPALRKLIAKQHLKNML